MNVLLAGLVLLTAASASAAPVLRYQADQRGDFTLVGNVLGQDCTSGSTPPVAPLVGTVGPNCGSNTVDSAADVFWTTDGDEASANIDVTIDQARSQAALTVPPGARITYARLYWAATRFGTQPADLPDQVVTISRPSGFSSTVTADASVTNTQGIYAYQSSADVTSLVQEQGPGIFQVAGVNTTPFQSLPNFSINDLFVSWWMVVFYEQDGVPLRQLTLFDGLEYVQQNTSITVPISGFIVPTTGYTARLGVISYEGDLGQPGDQLIFNGTAVSDSQNPVTNFFNGTRSSLGAPVHNDGDLPRFPGTPGSLTGIDMDVVDVTSLVNPNDTSANITASTTNDIYWLGAFVTSINTQRPDFTNTVKTVTNLTPHPDGGIRGGDTLEYTITTTNSGDDASQGTVLTDPLPASLTFVPGSLQVTSGANMGNKTDAANDDVGEYRAADRTLVVRLGSGATATQGGNMAIGDSTTVVFRATVNAGASGTINNQAFITASGALGTPATTTPSAPTSGGTKGPTPITAGGPPAPVILTPAANTYLTNNLPTYSGTAEPGNTVTVMVDGNPFPVCTTTADASGNWSCTSVTPLAEGPHTVSASAVDPAGNSSTSTTVPFTVDTVQPAAPTIASPANGSSIPSQTPYFTGTAEPNTQLTLVLDGVTYGPIAVSSIGGWEFPSPVSLSAGPHTVTVTTQDAAGNVSPTATSTFNVDVTVPDTSITSGPALVTNATGATFTFTATEASVSYECNLDGQGFVPCTSPTLYTGLTDGTHTFEVRARDAAGNQDPTPATYTWVVDTQLPDTVIDSGPAAVTDSTSATFAFSSNEAGVSYECSLDGATFTACSNPITYNGLAEGNHTLAVRAVDAAGNVDNTPATYAWKIDATELDTAFVSTPPSVSNQTSATFDFSANKSGVTYECSLDSGAFVPCTDPATFTDLADGGHTLAVRAVDSLGNKDPSPATYAWTVDTKLPDTLIVSGPAALTGSTSATFDFDSDETGVIYECSLDGATFTACSDPITYSGLLDGTHTLAVRAIDAAGNVDGTPATHGWTVDTQAPDTTFVTVPPVNSGSPDAVFTFEASEPGSTFECSLDGAVFTACPSPLELQSLVDGPHELKVRAIDAAGNVDPSPATYSWTVDASAPDTLIVSGPAAETREQSAIFDLGSNESGVTYQCSLDGAVFVACSDPTTFSNLADGSHTLAVRAIDASGNVDATPATYAWSIDTTPPDTLIASGPEALTSATSATFDFTANEANATYECSLDGAVYVPCSDPVTFSALADGPHTLLVRAVDALGNVDPTPAEHSWTVDSSIPDTTFVTTPPAISNTSTANFTFEASEPGSTFECSLDGAVFTACTTPATYANLADGSHTLQVRSIDPGSNVDPTPASYTWTVDTQSPEAPVITSPANGSTSNNAEPTFTGTAEPNTQLTLELDGVTYGPIAVGADGKWSFPAPAPLTEGSHTVTVTTTDGAGNVSPPATSTFTVDRTAPDTLITSGPAALTNSANAVFDFSSNESPVTYECSLDGAAYVACSDPSTFAGLTDGSHTLSVRATDAAGNVDATPATHAWTLDTTAPAAPAITGPTSGQVLSQNTVTYTGTAEPNALVTVVVDGNVVGTVTADASGSWSLPSGTLAEGPHTVSATATDAAGNVSTSSSVPFVVDAIPAETTDTDGDGLMDSEEEQLGTDPRDDDSDNDGLMDGTEDANHNGIVDAGETSPLEADSDKDGLLDGTELGLEQPEGQDTDASIFVADADPSTTTDPLDADTDGGSVHDGIEDRNHNGRVDSGETDPLKAADDKDADGDGIDNERERELGLDPFDNDSDNDGVPDGLDGITDTDGDGTLDALDDDSDNDGLKDGTELGVTAATAPAGTDLDSPSFVPDADPSTRTDPKKADSDDDGLADGTEDRNHDGRVDSGETDPNNADTDGGGANDGAESQNGGNPLDMDDDFLVAGRGCSASGTNPLPLVALLLGLPFLRRRRALGAPVKAGGMAAALLGVLGVLTSGTASAQTAPTQSIDVQQYKPAPGTTDILAVHGARVGSHMGLHVGLSLNYASNPLGVLDPRQDDFIYDIVRHQFTADVMGSISLFDRFELGVALPVTYQSSQGASATAPFFQNGLSGLGAGDLRLVPKAHLLNTGGFDLGLVVPVLFPTSSGTNFLGGSGVSAQPRVVAEWNNGGGLRLVANVGANFRREQQLRNLNVGNEVAYGVGAEVPLTQKLALQGNLNGSVGLEQQNTEEMPLELLAALRYRFASGLAAHVGAGPGITRGYGTPGFRLFAGLGYTDEAPRAAPAALACALGAEDVDGFEDGDNCLDADNDADGILDGPDVCPNEAETKNDFRDEDGCPDETLTAGTGSPEKLALTPAGDSDQDGIEDAADRCPKAAEDLDGFEDGDGCPDADNDRDGVADADDKCPLEAEVINSVSDEDGCPDKGKSKVAVESNRIVILDKVHFATGKADVLAKSFGLLKQVSSVLRANPQIERVRVEGHTDDQGADAKNLDLSQRRAANVRELLIKEGIAAERLEAVGHGETKPVASNKTASGREQNRRVEFNIVKVADETPATSEDVP